MNLSELCEKLSLTVVSGSEENLKMTFDGVYAGDLLSRAMSHVEAENLWITIMSNINVIAVASLTEAAAVILAEDVELIPEALDAAREKEITVLSSPLTVYELCVKIGALAS